MASFFIYFYLFDFIHLTSLLEGCHSGCRPSLFQINHMSLAKRKLLLQCLLKSYSSETGIEQVILKNGRRETRLFHIFSQLFNSSWMVPTFSPRVWALVQEGREGKWEITPNRTQHHLGPVPPQGGRWLGGHMGTDRQGSLSLCSPLQLDSLTWWTRHKKAPAINLENGQSEAEETKPEEREKDLVETAASGDMEEAGRDLPVNKHTPGLGVHSQHSMQTPKVHEGPPGAFTGAGACIYSFKDVTNENVLGPPNIP